MHVSRDGYYSWRKREKSVRQVEYEILLPWIALVAGSSPRLWGTLFDNIMS